MIMIWLLAEKTRSQRAKTMMPGEALGGFKAVGSSRALSVEDRRRPLSRALQHNLEHVDVSRSVRDVADYVGDVLGRQRRITLIHLPRTVFVAVATHLGARRVRRAPIDSRPRPASSSRS